MAKESGSVNVQVLLAGQTGVGRSTLINMIIGATQDSTWAARVSNDVRPCAIETTVHTAPLEVEGTTLQCSLWDTRGLDEAVDRATFIDMLRQQGFWPFPNLSLRHSERDLRNVCRKRISDLNDHGEQSRPASIVILMWCIHASKIDVPIHWQHFRKVYVEYCGRRVKPVVIITQMTPGFAKDWEKRCKEQLELLNLGLGSRDTADVLLMVRRYRDTSSLEYTEDSQALKDLIFRLSGRL